MKSDRSADFIRNMTAEPEPEPAAPVGTPPPLKRRKPTGQSLASAPTSRAGLKHIGGYVDTDTVEKVALLRVRLNLDNSELIKRAIDELYARHHAKRAFGDA
jgi:hypothetical protein